MTFRLATLVLLCSAASATAIAATQPAATEQARMDSTFQTLGEAFIREGRSDGMSIVVVKDGQSHFYNFGTTTRGKDAPPTEHSVYEIGSVSKLFNSLILAHAVTEGRISLQDDIRRYLPGDYPKLEWEGTPVRIVDLANTTSALPDNLPNPFPAGANPDTLPFTAVDFLRKLSPDQVYTELKSATLSRKPGTLPQHSNLAPDLLGRILEKVYGEPYEVLVARYIEQPLGMQTGTDSSRSADEVNGYNKRHVAMPRLDQRPILMAAGLRYSTTDMAKFITAQLAAADPAIRLTQQAAWGDPMQSAVGFNWTLSRTVDGKRRLRMSGSTLGCSSYIELYPDMGYGIILLANRPGNTQNEMQDLANQAREQIWGKPAALTALEQALQADGYRDAKRVVDTVKRTHPELHLAEDYVNAWAYRLMGQGEVSQAITLFRYNTVQHPRSSNTFDSLGEGYEKLGDSTQAIVSFRKALELDPQNRNSAEHLRKLMEK